MSNMRVNKLDRILVGACIGFVMLVAILFVMKYIFLCPWMFADNPSFNEEENREIKKIVLEVVKDRCSGLFSTEEELKISEEFEKSVICQIDASFMKKFYKRNENEYYGVVACYIPEEGRYYEFIIQYENGRYRITSFALDA